MSNSGRPGKQAIAPYIELPMMPPPRDRFLKRDEAKAVVAACAMPHVKAFVLLALMTGARTEAILELTSDRVSFERRQIAFGVFTGKKRKGRATAPMNDTLAKHLQEVKAGALTPWVVEYAGRRVGSVKKAVGRAVERTGLEDVTPRTFRHTAAVLDGWGRAGMVEIAAVLGHEDSRTTKRIYARYSPEGLRGAVSALDMDFG